MWWGREPTTETPGNEQNLPFMVYNHLECASSEALKNTIKKFGLYIIWLKKNTPARHARWGEQNICGEEQHVCGQEQGMCGWGARHMRWGARHMRWGARHVRWWARHMRWGEQDMCSEESKTCAVRTIPLSRCGCFADYKDSSTTEHEWHPSIIIGYRVGVIFCWAFRTYYMAVASTLCYFKNE